MITTLTDEQFDLLKSMALVVPISETETYYHLPFWFRKLGEGKFQRLKMNDVPDGVKYSLDYYNGIKPKNNSWEEQEMFKSRKEFEEGFNSMINMSSPTPPNFNKND